MQKRALGESGIDISRVIMGTWQAGKAMWSGIDDKETTRAIRSAYDHGITTFDTAEVYGNGHSEKIIGKALEGVRDKVVIATKVFSNHLKYQQVIRACHRSLKHLDTDYIDLYQIHWPTGSFGHPEIPLEETVTALVDLKTQGKIRAIGVSNFNRNQVSEILKYVRIDSLQPPYSLFWRAPEADVMPYCLEKNITILAYSSMAQGLLTGKFKADHQFEKGDHRSQNILFQKDHFKRVQKALTQLAPVAEKYKITLGQLALTWVISHPNTCAIAGARNARQVSENALAGAIQISDKDLKKIDAIGKTVSDPVGQTSVMWNW